MRRIFSTSFLFVALAAATTSCSTQTSGNQAGGAPPANADKPASAPPANAGRAANGPQRADANVVRASAGEVEVKAGGRAQAEVRLDISEGYHVNANPPTDKNLIGTELTVAPAGGITAGSPVYPRAVSRKFEFDERPLAVYEREAVIKLPIAADQKAAKGPQTLSAKIRVQPCNDKECFPPRTVETSIPVTVN